MTVKVTGPGFHRSEVLIIYKNPPAWFNKVLIDASTTNDIERENISTSLIKANPH
jgi:hypothetical protein